MSEGMSEGLLAVRGIDHGDARHYIMHILLSVIRSYRLMGNKRV